MALQYPRTVGYPTAPAEHETQENVGPAVSAVAPNLDRAASVPSYQPAALVPNPISIATLATATPLFSSTAVAATMQVQCARVSAVIFSSIASITATSS